MQKFKMFAFAGWALVVVLCLLGQSAAKNSGDRENSSGGVIARGKVLYRSNCLICHYDTSDKKKVGPGLKGLSARGTYADGSKVDDATLRHWIERGGKNMPGFRNTVTDSEVRDLIAYLKTL